MGKGYVNASDPEFGYIPDGSLSPASVNRNQDAIQRAIYRCNPTNANGTGGLVILERGWGACRGDFDNPTGVELRGEGEGATILNIGNGCNPYAMFKPHTWKPGAQPAVPPRGPNASNWKVTGLTIDMRHAAQGAKVIDATIVKDSNVIASPTHAWFDNEHVVGSGLLPDTYIIRGTTTVAPDGQLAAVMSAPAQQTLSPAYVYCGIDHPMYGIWAETYPRAVRDQTSGDMGFDPKGRISNVEIRNSRDGGIYGYGRSGLRMSHVTVSNTLGISFTTTFDTQGSHLYSDFAAWGGLLILGSSCQFGVSKFFNSGQATTTPGAKVNDGYGVRIPGYYSLITLTGLDAQQNSGDSYDLSSTGAPTTLITLDGVTSSSPGYLAPKDTTGQIGAVGFNLDNATKCVIGGTHYADTGTAAIRMPVNSKGHSIHLGCTGTVLTADSVVAGNHVIVNGAQLA